MAGRNVIDVTSMANGTYKLVLDEGQSRQVKQLIIAIRKYPERSAETPLTKPKGLTHNCVFFHASIGSVHAKVVHRPWFGGRQRPSMGLNQRSFESLSSRMLTNHRRSAAEDSLDEHLGKSVALISAMSQG